MAKHRDVVMLVVAMLVAQRAAARNPIIKKVGAADPHVHLWNNRFYLYSTHDFSPDNGGFLMKDWWTWSSADLVSWAQEDVLDPWNTPAPVAAYDQCWATDGATLDANGNGPWWFYLSIGGDQVAVMQSDVSPAGPWVDVLGAPLLNSSLGASLNTTIRDPTVYVEDGIGYIVFGVFTYYIARLNPDMVSLAEAPRLLTVIDPTGPYGNSTDDKPFLHKGPSGVYYLSWGCFYGIGSSPYGPFTYAGTVIDTSFISPAFRTNNTNPGGPWYTGEDYSDRHGSFWTAFGQWYFITNDRSHSSDTPGNRAYYRDSVIGYLSYYPNNTMAPVRIDETGVGEFDARRGAPDGRDGVVEGEDYFAIATEVRGSSDSRLPVDGSIDKDFDEAACQCFGVRAHRNSTALYPRIAGLPQIAASDGRLSAMLRLSNAGPTAVRVTLTLCERGGPRGATGVQPLDLQDCPSGASSTAWVEVPPAASSGAIASTYAEETLPLVLPVGVGPRSHGGHDLTVHFGFAPEAVAVGAVAGVRLDWVRFDSA